MVEYVTIDNVLGGLSVTNMPPFGETYWEVPDGIDPEKVYIHGNEARIKTDRPSKYHVWNDDVETWVFPDEAIAELRFDGSARVNYLRGKNRLQYITDLPGQDALYGAKREEAIAYLNDPAPIDDYYPLVKSEIGTTAPTEFEVAQIFLNLNDLWRQAAGAIDAACFNAQALIANASTIDEVNQIVAELETSLNQALS